MDSNKDTLYARWLAGKISKEEEQDLKASGELSELQAIINAADKLYLPKYDAAAGYNRFKENNTAPKTAKVRKLSSRIVWQFLALAASVLVIVYIVNTGMNAPDTIQTGNLATLTHQFEDQSFVVLNDGSSLTYKEADWKQERSVKLIGEAVFNVQKGKPFIVNTIAGSIEVLGTSFNVRAWTSDVRVECYTGKVRVRYGDQETILTAGESVNGILGKMREKQAITHEKPLWATGNSKFYETATYQVFEELERQYDVKVNISKITRPFSGSFPHNNLENALNNICKPMNLKYSISTDKKVINIEE